MDVSRNLFGAPFATAWPSAILFVGLLSIYQCCYGIAAIYARDAETISLLHRDHGWLPLPDDLHRWSRWANSRGHPSEELPTSAESLLLYCSQFWYQNLVRTGDSLHQDKPVKTNLCVWDSFAKFSSRLFFFSGGNDVPLEGRFSSVGIFSEAAEEDANIHEECQQPWINART